SQAYLALARRNYSVFDGIVEDLERRGGVSSMTGYYSTIRAYLTRNYDLAKQNFETAVLADPANYDLFIERGNETLDAVNALGLTGSESTARRRIAKAYFQAALNARPESFEALTGMSVVCSILGEKDEAISFGRGATA